MGAAAKRGIGPGCVKLQQAYGRTSTGTSSDPSKGMPIHVGLFVVLTLLFCVMRRQVRRWTAAGEGSSGLAMTVFDRPFSAALVVTLFVATSPNLPTPPYGARTVCDSGNFAPMIRLTKPVVDPLVGHRTLHTGVLFTLNTVREAFAGAPLVEQAAILIEVLAGMAVLGWALTFGNLRRSDGHAKSFERLSGLRADLQALSCSCSQSAWWLEPWATYGWRDS